VGTGKEVNVACAVIESPLGLFMIGATDRGICFAQFGDSRQALLNEHPGAGGELPRAWVEAVAAHLEGRQPRLDLPLDLHATAFQMTVWNYLRSIPFGELRTYSEVAAGIGSPQAARAVARACATNPIAVIIPCHRVVRTTGGLGGYRWGLARKQALIERERAAAARIV
jgi:AraC family transcriptional regulator of adaptative response/methylated-DNA-[protein]-cysteine methyltransferase